MTLSTELAPQRIWLLDYGTPECTWCDDPSPSGEDHSPVEYVRADVALKAAETPLGDVAGRLARHAEFLATLPLGIDLGQWSNIANDMLGADAIITALTRQLGERDAEVARLKDANGIFEDALQEAGDDYPGSNMQKWCQQRVKAARQALMQRPTPCWQQARGR